MDKEGSGEYALFSYSLKSLQPKDKVKVIRELFGYKDKKKSKTYYHKGLVEELRGRKFGANVILIPREHALTISNYFGARQLKVEILEVLLKLRGAVLFEKPLPCDSEIRSLPTLLFQDPDPIWHLLYACKLGSNHYVLITVRPAEPYMRHEVGREAVELELFVRLQQLVLPPRDRYIVHCMTLF